jgi:hypothetical protein
LLVILLVMTLALGLQPRQNMERCGLKMQPGSHIFTPRSVRELIHTFPSGFSLSELESLWSLKFSKRYFKGSKFVRLKISLYQLKVLEMSKMNLHDSSKYLKDKLWQKKRSGIVVPILFPFTKSRKSPWNMYVQVVCHILLKSSWQGLHFCFRPHLNWRSAQEVIAFQNIKSPNFENFRNPK